MPTQAGAVVMVIVIAIVRITKRMAFLMDKKKQKIVITIIIISRSYHRHK